MANPRTVTETDMEQLRSGQYGRKPIEAAPVKKEVHVIKDDPLEVEYFLEKFPQLQHSQVVEAIHEKGPQRVAIYDHLKTLK